MGMYTVESNLLKLESKKFINGGKGITNAKIVPKKGTHRKLRKNNLALSHNSFIIPNLHNFPFPSVFTEFDT